MRTKSLIWSAILLLMLVAYMPVMAQDAPEAAGNSQAAKSGDATAPESSTVFSGGVVKSMNAITENEPKTRGEGAYLLVPGASITIVVPPNEIDHIVATFSGECRLYGTTGDRDWIQVQIRDNGIAMQPTTDIADPVAFCSENRWSSHSIQAVQKLGPGAHRIQVVWKLEDRDTNDTLTGWLDDYALTVLRSD